MNITTAVVTGGNAAAGTYTVKAEPEGVLRDVIFAGGGGGEVYGPKSDIRPAPGATVIVAYDKLYTAYIISVLPKKELSTATVAAGVLYPFVSGPKYNQILNTPTYVHNHDVQTEDLYPGATAGYSNELGVAAGIGMYEAYLRASPMCGVWAMYLDDCLRTVGYNREDWHSGGSHCVKNIGGEVNDCSVFTPFSWEALGFNKPGDPFDKDLTPEEEKAADEGEASALDTEGEHWKLAALDEESPEMLPRVMKYSGYTPGLHRLIVARPGSTAGSAPSTKHATGLTDPKDTDTANSLMASAKNHRLISGLFDMSIDNCGEYEVRSAKGISHVKTVDIPIPVQASEPETTFSESRGLPGSETPHDYTPAGLQNLGEPHKEVSIKGPAGRRAQSVSEGSGLRNTVLNSKAEAKSRSGWDVEYAVSPLQAACARFDISRELDSRFEYDTPQPTTLLIDHETKAEYYGSESGIKQLDDGSIVLYDGYGASITMAGGNIIFDAPGDIWNRTGRDVITWAGRSINSRAENDVEIVADTNEVRIKSETAMKITGGNGGSGSTFLENRADAADDGVVVKSVNHTAVFTTHLDVPTEINVGTINATNTHTETGYIDTAQINALTAMSGDFGGTSAKALEAVHAATASNAPAPVPGPAFSAFITKPGGNYTEDVTGLTAGAPAVKFEFPGSDAFGHGGDYGFAVYESRWQRQRRAHAATSSPSVKSVGDTMPFPGKTTWDSDVFHTSEFDNTYEFGKTEESKTSKKKLISTYSI